MQTDDLYVLLVFVVDDIMIASDNEEFVEFLVEEFKDRYKITDMGVPEYILGMHLHYDRGTDYIHLSQERYAH